MIKKIKCTISFVEFFKLIYFKEMSSFDVEKVIKYLEIPAEDKDMAHSAMSVDERQAMTGLMKCMHDALQSICVDEFSKLEPDSYKK
jgi:hypothetical protein